MRMTDRETNRQPDRRVGRERETVRENVETHPGRRLREHLYFQVLTI
jgi:hypothetical protein